MPEPTPAERRPASGPEAVMHEMPYGMYVIGSTADGRPNGMIADWVMQVSFEPRMIAVSFENDARSLARVRQTGVFTANLLPATDEGMALAARFLQPSEGAKVRGRSAEEAARQHDKLEGVAFRTTDSGCPVLEDALAWVECNVEQFIAAGDHTLVLGRVVDGETQASGDPLTSLYTGWTYSG